MLSVHLICVGKLKEKFYLEAAAEYQKRLSAYCRLTLVELPEEKLPVLGGFIHIPLLSSQTEESAELPRIETAAAVAALEAAVSTAAGLHEEN